jgi:hypothetical protein
MIKTLTYTIDTDKDSAFDDEMAMLCAMQSMSLALALWDIQNIRKKLEYLEDESKLTSDGVMDIIADIITEHGIILDNLIR